MAKKQFKAVRYSEMKPALDKVQKDWEHGDTSLLHLSAEEQLARLGLEIPAGEQERIKLKIPKSDRNSGSAKEKTDWRNYQGENWVTDIRDQGNCGSCVSFGTVAALEAQGRFETNRPEWDLNLSEADLFFCGAGRKCGQGWWPAYALDFVRDKGVGEEHYFPYQDHDMDCKRTTETPPKILTIESWKELTSRGERQEWISNTGPVVACMAVYRDFFLYKSGIYQHKEGDLAGYHAICCIGYNKKDRYWICKNSWGKDWGEKGYFKIAFGEAMIDTDFAMYGASKIDGSIIEGNNKGLAEQIIIDRESSNARNILWALVNGRWRHLFLTDTQSGDLMPAIFAAKKVLVYYNGNNEITRYLALKN